MVKQPSEGFFKKDVMRSFAKFTRKHLCQNLIFGVFLSILLIRITAVSMVVKGVLANDTVNYDTQTKTYVLILGGSVSY